MREPRPILGGIPTKPEVDALMKAFANAKVGDLIPYDEITAITNVAYKNPRFRTVSTAFRRALLRQKNLDVAAVPGRGLKVLTASERVLESVADFHRGARKIRRSAARIALTPFEELPNAVERSRADHARRLIEATYSVARHNSKTIAIDFRPPMQLPRGR